MYPQVRMYPPASFDLQYGSSKGPIPVGIVIGIIILFLSIIILPFTRNFAITIIGIIIAFLAMMSIKIAAENIIEDGSISNVGMTKIEMAIRAYDPCFTCAAHNIREMVKNIEIIDEKGTLINKIEF